MVTHLLAGALIFFGGSDVFGFQFNIFHLFCGMLLGWLPDGLSLLYGFKLKGESHRHRDNWSHSIVWHPLAAIVIWLFDACILGVLAPISIGQFFLCGMLALVSHPLLDSFGLGFGIRPFRGLDKIFKGSGRAKTLSGLTFYLQGFWRGEKVWYTQEEITKIISEKKNDNWFREMIWTWPWKSKRKWIWLSEYLSLFGLIGLLVWVCVRS